MSIVVKPRAHPMATQRNTSPDFSIPKPYTLPNVYGMAAKKLNSMPKLIATYRHTSVTSGSVRTICIGRVTPTRRNSWHRFQIGGRGGRFCPRCLASFLLTIGRYVSRRGIASSIVARAKNKRIHCVHRQSWRLTAKEPITGLFSPLLAQIACIFQVASKHLPQSWTQERHQDKNRHDWSSRSGYKRFGDGAATNGQCWTPADASSKTQYA